jgi:hypothetical protein
MQGERQVRRPEYRLVHEYDAGVTRNPDVAAAVDVELLGAQIPGIVAGFAGRVIGRFNPVLPGALKQQAFRGAARVADREWRTARRPVGGRAIST